MISEQDRDYLHQKLTEMLDKIGEGPTVGEIAEIIASNQLRGYGEGYHTALKKVGEELEKVL